jgi:hypothetical protein
VLGAVEFIEGSLKRFWQRQRIYFCEFDPLQFISCAHKKGAVYRSPATAAG